MNKYAAGKLHYILGKRVTVRGAFSSFVAAQPNRRVPRYSTDSENRRCSPMHARLGVVCLRAPGGGGQVRISARPPRAQESKTRYISYHSEITTQVAAPCHPSGRLDERTDTSGGVLRQERGWRSAKGTRTLKVHKHWSCFSLATDYSCVWLSSYCGYR